MIKTIRCCFLVLTFLALAVVVSPVSALAQTFSVLYNFNNSANSTDPLDFVFPGTFAQGQNGNIFTTSANGGGTFNSGTVFTMTTTGGLSELTAAPEFTYILEISPAQSKPDGNYHSLKVKLDRDGLQLQARRGYFEPKPEKSKK